MAFLAKEAPVAHAKSTIDEIRARFDKDVERFSNLDTGQVAIVDGALVLDLLPAAAAAARPDARAILDVGCGAGNFSIKLLQHLPGLECTLLDLSAPMLQRARERVAAAGASRVATVQEDIRTASLAEGSFDIVVAVAVLHHLRDAADWESTFAKLFRLLRPGGWLWISDLVIHDDPGVHALMWRRYGEYLEGVRGAAYRDEVFAYIEKEDTPRSLPYQLDLMRRTGFELPEVLHKNGVQAAFGARRPH